MALNSYPNTHSSSTEGSTRVGHGHPSLDSVPLNDTLRLPIRKKKIRRQKKAPGAPKRGKSPYILFSMEMREKIKNKMPPDSKVTDIVKAIAHEWALIKEEDRKPWFEAAAKDKKRYEDEMATYDGPLRIPNTRSKKVPSVVTECPRRPMAAFSIFANDLQKYWSASNVSVSPSDASAKISEIWDTMDSRMKFGYEQRERLEKQRFEDEMKVYRGNLSKQNYVTMKQPKSVKATEELSPFPLGSIPPKSTIPSINWLPNQQAPNLLSPIGHPSDFSYDQPQRHVSNEEAFGPYNGMSNEERSNSQQQWSNHSSTSGGGATGFDSYFMPVMEPTPLYFDNGSVMQNPDVLSLAPLTGLYDEVGYQEPNEFESTQQVGTDSNRLNHQAPQENNFNEP